MRVFDRSAIPPTPRKLGIYGALTIGVWLFSWLSQMAKGWWLIGTGGQPLVSSYLCIWAAGKITLIGNAAAGYDWDELAKVQVTAVGPEPIVLPWLYPPSFLPAAACLSLLPYLWSCAAWLLLTGIGYVATLRAILPHRLAIVLALAAPPAFLNLIETETGYAIAALTGIALLLLETRPILAGVALGVLTFKPQLGLLFPLILIVTGQWRAFFSAAATTFLITGLTTVLFGIDVWSAYLQAVPTIGNIALGGEDSWWDVQTWYSVARYLGAGPTFAWTVYALTTGGCAAAICWLWRKPVRYNFKAAALATGSFLVTPYVMSYDSVLLVVAVTFLVRENLVTGCRRGDIEIYCLTLIAPLYPLAAHGIVPLLPMAYTGLLVWIAWRARIVGAADLEPQQVFASGKGGVGSNWETETSPRVT